MLIPFIGGWNDGQTVETDNPDAYYRVLKIPDTQIGSVLDSPEYPLTGITYDVQLYSLHYKWSGGIRRYAYILCTK